MLSPHPDDETLSMGVWAADAIHRGDRVIAVCLTDGGGTGARPVVSRRLGRPLSIEDVAAARILEMRAAVSRLGVADEDVVLAHLDRARSAGAERITQSEVYGVIETLAQRYPAATYLTMSYAAERHPDHLSAGRALWHAARNGLVRSSQFAVSRLWWQLPAPPSTWVRPSTARVADHVRAAADEYGRWDPARHRYAVGWASVRRQFRDLQTDPRDRVHPWHADSSLQALVTPRLAGNPGASSPPYSPNGSTTS